MFSLRHSRIFQISRRLVARCTLMLLCTSGAAFGEVSSGFDRANQLYDQGKFAEAKNAYESLVNAHNISANLFHNLGNTDYRLGDPAGAIVAYERAILLDPSHAEARANLKLVQNETGAKHESQTWRDRVIPEFGENGFVIAAATGTWMALFSLVAVCFRRKQKNAGLWVSGAAGLLVAGYAVFAVFELERKNSASIVIEKVIEARLAPAAGAPTVQALSMGARVRVISERGTWDYCALPDSGRGWIPAKAVERIRPPAS